MSDSSHISELELSFRVSTSYQIEGDYLRIKSRVRAANGAEFEEPEGLLLPITAFADDSGQVSFDSIEEYRRGVDGIVADTINEALLREIALHVTEVAQLLTVEKQLKLKPMRTALEMINVLAKLHAQVITGNLKVMMAYQPESTGGRQARWTKELLQTLILMAMRVLKPEHRTYPLVAKKMREIWPDRISGKDPASALKKLVSRYHLDWEELKATVDLVDPRTLLPKTILQDYPERGH